MLDRRHFLTAAAAASALPVLASAAGAQTPETGPAPTAAPAERAQVPAFFRIKVGDALVTAVGDGTLALPGAVMPSVSADEFAASMRAGFLPEDAYGASLNSFVVETGGRVVLIDAGGSERMAPTVGRLLPNLSAAGYAPADISHILLTHMHGDHVGGMVDAAGAAVFPNAEVVVRDRELAFWTDPAQADTIPEGQRGMVDLAKSVAAAYDGRITTFADDVAVLDGIEAVALYGHTPGHTGYRITGGPGLLIWGDIVHIPPVQMGKPEASIGFDVTPPEAIEIRKRIFEQVAADRTMVAGMHLPFPSFGHVTTAGAGYAFVPVPYSHTL